MKYKIEIVGRGFDCFIHKITEEQLNDLIVNEIESNLATIDEVAEILSIDDPLETDLVHTGFYNNPEQFERHQGIVISNEDKNKWYEKRKQQMLSYKYNFIYKEELPELNVIEHSGLDVVIH